MGGKRSKREIKRSKREVEMGLATPRWESLGATDCIHLFMFVYVRQLWQFGAGLVAARGALKRGEVLG